MPIYEYRCKSCGRTVEMIQKVGDKPLRRCDACDGAMEKIVSRAAFHLKGSGWYSTGYHKGGSTSGESEGSGAESSGDAKPKDSASGTPGGSKPGGCGPGCGCH